jgi:hypothetical protein
MKHNQSYSLYGKQSNSLQNLLDDSHYQSSSHQSHTSSKKHKHRKNSTSVSTRRLEGGSLPIDMHHSSAAVQSPPDQPFLSEYKNNKKRKEKQQTVMDAGDNETDEKKMMQRHFDSGITKDVSWKFKKFKKCVLKFKRKLRGFSHSYQFLSLMNVKLEILREN